MATIIGYYGGTAALPTKTAVYSDGTTKVVSTSPSTTTNSGTTTVYHPTLGTQTINNQYLTGYQNSGWSTTPIKTSTTTSSTSTTTNPGTTTGTTTSGGGTTTTTPISSANLRIGSRGTDVTNLQNFLISQGYNVGATGADGIFGPNTAAAVKAYQTTQGLTPDAIVGVNTAGRMNATLTAPTITQPETTVPTPIVPPVLPKQEDPYESYYTALQREQEQLQIKLDNMRNEQLARIQEDKAIAQQELADIRNSQIEALNEQGSLVLEEKQKKLEALDLETQRFNEAYKLKQGFVTQLTNLMTEGNALIASQKATTGLTAIRNPRVNETIANLTAAAGILKIGIDAQDNNMSQVQAQLNSSVNAITSAYKSQLDYYTTLYDFYNTTAEDSNQRLITLTKNEQDFLDTTIANLQNKITTIEENAQAIKNLFIDPDTAVAFAKAGITLLTPQSEWGEKLAKQAYADELVEQSNEMAKNGYTALVSGNAPAGAEVVRITDSSGNIKTYWKKSSGGGTGTGGGKVLDVLDIQRLTELYPEAGIMFGDTEASAQNKIQKYLSPEAQAIRNAEIIKENGTPYKEALAAASNQIEIDAVKKVYGITETTNQISQTAQERYAPVGSTLSSGSGMNLRPEDPFDVMRNEGIIEGIKSFFD